MYRALPWLGRGAHFQNHCTPHLLVLCLMTEFNISYGVDTLAPARDVAAPAHEPRSGSPNRLVGLSPHVVRMCDSNATDRNGTKKVISGKKVEKHKKSLIVARHRAKRKKHLRRS